MFWSRVFLKKGFCGLDVLMSIPLEMDGPDHSLEPLSVPPSLPSPPVASPISRGENDLQEELLRCPEYRFRLLIESVESFRRSDGVSDTDSERLIGDIRSTSSSLLDMRKRKASLSSAKAESPKEKKEKSEPLVSHDFECNVCIELAKEPVVTCCGHLFCWPCLYRWLHVHSSYGECPVCKGKVNESSIVPIYGRGSSESSTEKKSEEEASTGLKIPPRPQGNRVESLRQQLLSGSSRVAALEERFNALFEEFRPRNTWGLTRHAGARDASQPPASLDRSVSRLSAMFNDIRSDSEPGVSQTSISSTIARMQGINSGIGSSAEPSRGPRRRMRRVSSVALGTRGRSDVPRQEPDSGGRTVVSRSGSNNAGVVSEPTSADTNDLARPHSGGHSMVLRSRTRSRISGSSSEGMRSPSST